MHAAAEVGEEGAVYNIGTAARKSGLSVTTIRTWEDRYGAVVPVRDPSGRRLYSTEQISQLTWLRQQIDAGLRASEAHRLLISGDTEPRGPSGVVVDHGSAWATFLIWAEQESSWISSVLSDMRRGLHARATALAAVVDNAIAGPILTITGYTTEGDEPGALREIAVVIVGDIQDLKAQLAEGEAVTRPGADFGASSSDVTVAPINLSGVLAGALIGVDHSSPDARSLIERGVRVIESRIEADRARSAFSSLLD
ncbi:MAG TPA: MerR family transcriptional regulator [Acidimicrobiia bacterium]|nr:MerR family transcriptional regulator [Acidimicrobiia bacterium]